MLSKFLLYLLPALFGLIVIFGTMFLQTHYIDAYFKVSAKYNNHLHFPVGKMLSQIISLFDFNHLPPIKKFQSSLCIIGGIIICIINYKRYLRNQLNSLEIISTIYSCLSFYTLVSCW